MRKLIALLLLTIPLAASPRLLSPERPIGETKPLNNTLADFSIDIAAGDDSVVAAWSDGRSGTHNDIYATRLDAEGQPLDQFGIPVDVSPGDKQLRRIIWDGHRYVLAWSSEGAIWISSLTGGATRLFEANTPYTTIDLAARPGGGTLMVANVVRQLSVLALDDEFHVQSTHLIDTNSYRAQLVRSGDAVFAVWLDASMLLAQRIDRNGTPDGIPLQLATTKGPVNVVTSSSATRGLIAYYEQESVHVLALQPNGVFAPLTTYPALRIDSIAPAPDGGFVAVEGVTAETPTTLHHFDAGGNFVDRLSLGSFDDVRLTAGHGHVIAVGAGSGLVSYVYGARRTKNISFTSPVQTQPRLASDGTNALLLWDEQLPGDRLFVQLLAPSGEPLHDRVALPAPGYREVPAVGFDGNSFVVIRSKAFEDHTEISVQRIHRDGSLDGALFLLAQTKGPISDLLTAGNVVAWRDESYPQPRAVWTTFDQRTPFTASTSTHLAAGAFGSSVMFASITPNNTIVVWTPGGGDITVPINASPDSVAIGGNGDGWLVVYSDGGDLLGRYLARDGSAIGEPLLIESGEAHDMRVAWDGDAFVVTWESHHTGFMAVVRGRDVDLAFPYMPNGDITRVNGSALIAYQRRAPEANNSTRVFTRTLSRPRVRPVR